jgi:hypothetical protein
MKDFNPEDIVQLAYDEDDLTEYALNSLSPYFNIHTQVKGVFNGKNMRIDAVVTPVDTSLWKNKDIALGIEFKSCHLAQTKDLTGTVGQLVDYSLTEWDQFGQVPIFTCPGFSHRRTARNDDFTSGFNYAFGRLMKEFNIGELLLHHFYGWSFVMADSHDMWTQHTGVSEGKNWCLARKYGNRGVGAKSK